MGVVYPFNDTFWSSSTMTCSYTDMNSRPPIGRTENGTGFLLWLFCIKLAYVGLFKGPTTYLYWKKNNYTYLLTVRSFLGFFWDCSVYMPEIILLLLWFNRTTSSYIPNERKMNVDFSHVSFILKWNAWLVLLW